jgi:endonuclease/exonuclease/phosphatase family metal-dependent hydrolase
MRVATFNILNGRVPTDQHVDLDGFRTAIREIDADVLALQEVDRNQHRSDHADLTAIAAQAMGAPEHQFVAALSGSPGSTWIAATGEEQPDSAAYGIALLSRFPVQGWQVVRLAALQVPVPMRFKGKRLPEMVRDEPRVAVVAAVRTPQGCVTFVNTHLSFIDQWNTRQLKRLVTSLAEESGPFVLMGDLNMGPEPAARVSGLRPVASQLTFPVEAPTQQLDHILVRGPIRGGGDKALALPVSDHRALVAELSLDD